MPRGVQVTGIEELDVAPRTVYEPGHPEANDKGLVAYPGVDHVRENMAAARGRMPDEAMRRRMAAHVAGL